MIDGRSYALIVLVVAVGVAACGPQAGPAPAAPAGPAQGPPSRSAAKVVRIGVSAEPLGFLVTGGGRNEGQILDIAHATLVRKNDKDDLLPRLAREVPSVQNGGWKVAADGSMEITWRLRPNIKWHDGQPMTSNDLLFTWEYLQHPQALISRGRWFAAVDRLSAPDPHTLIVHYKRTYALADRADLRSLPRHILGPIFASGDIDAFNSGAHWRDEFIGLGPFKLTRWEAGSHMEFARFDEYFLGPPSLDRVIYSFYPDPNTLIANILAGEIDVHLPVALAANHALDLQQRWAGTGNRVLVGSQGTVRYLQMQYRSEVDVRPAALRERAVHQALYRAFDREAYNEALTLGLGKTADSWVPPDDPRRQIPLFRDSIVQYPYDPARAQRELEALGWRTGPDGILVNVAGERFEFEVSTSPNPYASGELGVVGDMYKTIGLSILQRVLSNPEVGSNEYLSNLPHWIITARPVGDNRWQLFELHSSNIGTPANRYNGSNRGGYVHSELDALYDRFVMTISPDERVPIEAGMLKIVTTDLPVLFTLWNITVITAVAKVQNVSTPNPYTGHQGMAWNIAEWDIR